MADDAWNSLADDRRSNPRLGRRSAYPKPSGGNRRAGDTVSVEKTHSQLRKSWQEHYKSGKPMSQWEKPASGQVRPKAAARSGPRSFSKMERNRLLARSTRDIGSGPGPVWKEPKDITRMTSSNPIGRANAGKYLRNKAIAKGLANMTKGQGTLGRIASTAKNIVTQSVPALVTIGIEGAYGTVETGRMKYKENQAKMGTAVLKAGIRAAKVKKVISTNREKIPTNIKVN